MSPNFFHSQIKRLISTYGETAFKTERADLIWRFVHDMSDEWMRKSVDNFIATSRYAPLPDDFREAARIDREEKVIPLRRDNFHSTIEPEQVSKLFDIARGRLPKNEVKEMEKILWNVALGGVRCRLCLDEGFVNALPRNNPHSSPYVFKCSCQSGQKLIENYPVWRSNLVSEFRVILNGPEPDGAA